MTKPPSFRDQASIAALVGVCTICVLLLTPRCSSGVPMPELPTLPTLPAKEACRVMATQPLWTVTEPDLVNLGDLKALVARLKACNAKPDGGL
jgi:hypothetical protein